MLTISYYLSSICKTCTIDKNIHNSAYIFSTEDMHIVCDKITRKITVWGFPSLFLDFKHSFYNAITFNNIMYEYVNQHKHIYEKKFFLNQKIKEGYERFFDSYTVNRINIVNPSTNSSI
jgi:hypothetical protein